MYEANYINNTKNFYRFEDALKWIYKKLKKDVNNMSYQCLETMIWIVDKANGNYWNWYNMRDFGHEIGILKDGKLVN